MLHKFEGIGEGYSPSSEAKAFAEKNVAVTYERHEMPNAPQVKAGYWVVRVFWVVVYFLADDHKSFAGSARSQEETWKMMLAWMYDRGKIVDTSPVSDVGDFSFWGQYGSQFHAIDMHGFLCASLGIDPERDYVSLHNGNIMVSITNDNRTFRIAVSRSGLDESDKDVWGAGCPDAFDPFYIAKFLLACFDERVKLMRSAEEFWNFAHVFMAKPIKNWREFAGKLRTDYRTQSRWEKSQLTQGG